ncbi:MAG: 50S ribosomal protein L25/general stress protein Ctc [Campylobacterales bacterium]|nr:50S ribosomal protein L25/general stress protein Ctc [Campylobacterales bacterium]
MLEGIIRESTEKPYTKALKKDGYLIANVYGAGFENLNVAFKKNEFIKYARRKETLAFDIKCGDKKAKVIIQEYQKHPVTSDLTHVDLRAVEADKVGKFLVPVRAEGTPVGLKNKGVLVYMHRRIPVKCKPADLPNEFVVNVDNLDTGDSIIARNIETPANVTVTLNPSVAVVGVIKAK